MSERDVVFLAVGFIVGLLFCSVSLLWQFKQEVAASYLPPEGT